MGSRLPRGKRVLHVLVSEDVYRKLVEVAPRVYGVARGGMSALVDEALRLYLRALESGVNLRNTRFYRLLIDARDIVREAVRRGRMVHYTELAIILNISPSYAREVARALAVIDDDLEYVDGYLFCATAHNLMTQPKNLKTPEGGNCEQ
ncbi:MAG: hypothetical protein DRO14_03255 [Thermoprotei archaeon]|nr:MAG: hypothetical protein DRO14_03255 [Thermoprotei archaeon]